MLLQNTQVAIVGGGPGGLTLARLLQQQGAAATVYERDRNGHERVQGGTLDLHHESGLAALHAAGLLEEFKARYRPGADRLRLTDKHATVVHDEHANGHAVFGDAAFRPEIDRGPLRDLLLHSLQPDTVMWDSQLVSVQSLGAGWQLVFRSGATATADILIGADGANSRIRPLLTPIKPFYSGVTIVEGSIYDSARNARRLHELTQGGKVFALDDAKTVVVSAKGDGSLSFYTGSKTAETWARDSGIDFSNAAQVLGWFQKEFAGWDVIWTELFGSQTTHCVPRPQYCMPFDQTWETRPNLTLIGDAAHLMPPYAGEGVNMAMLDALELSGCLTSAQFPNLQAAIGHYELQMRRRASAVAQETMEQTAALHAPGSLAHLVGFFGLA